MTTSAQGRAALARGKGRGAKGAQGRGPGGVASVNTEGSSPSPFLSPTEPGGSAGSARRGAGRARGASVSTPLESGAPSFVGSESTGDGGSESLSQKAARRPRSKAQTSEGGKKVGAFDPSAEGMLTSMSEAPDTHLSPGR